MDRSQAGALLLELVADKAESRLKAKCLELRVAFCWWGSVILAGLASVIGLLAAIPDLQTYLNIKPWCVSVFALGSGGLVILRRKTSWRKKSDIFYGREADVGVLISRLKYQLPLTPTLDQVAQIARDFEAAKALFGARMHSINALEDEAEHGKAAP